MSRFNKNGKNLSEDKEAEWLEANATPVSTEGKAETKEEPKETEAPAKEEASTKQPDEGKSETEKPKKRRGRRRSNNKKGD